MSFASSCWLFNDLVVLVAGITGSEAAACSAVVTAGDEDLETGEGVEDREVGGGDTCGGGKR